MKKIQPKTQVSFILSGISLALTFYQYQFTPAYFDFRLIAGPLGIIAWLAASSEYEQYTSNYQFAGMFLGAAALGMSLDQFLHAFPFQTAALLLSIFVMSWRHLLRRWVSETSYPALDYLFFLLPLSLYVTGNLTQGLGWNGWVYPVPVIALSMFFQLNSMMNIRTSLGFTKKGFAIEIGKAAPDFCLPDGSGNSVTLGDYKAKSHVMLIFVRGDWCPSCHIMLRTYDRHADKFKEKGITMFAIGPDPVGVNRAMVEKLGVEVNVLSDEGQKTSMAYGVHLPWDLVGEKYKPGIPLPAAFLIDKKGIIRYTTRPDRIGEFLAPETIFPILETLN